MTSSPMSERGVSGAERVWMGKSRPSVQEDFDRIRVGDVIRWKGRPRTVRALRRSPDGCIRVIEFAKLRRSGYDWPLAIYWRSELRTFFGGTIARRKGPLCATDLECALTAQTEADPKAYERLAVTERDIAGVIW